MTPDPLRFVQLTDSHVREAGCRVGDRIDTAAGLERTIDSVLALPQPPAAVVMTGDLVDGGRPAEYRRLRELIGRLPMPVYLLPGNHDDRAALREVFADHRWLAGGVPVAGPSSGPGAAAIQYHVRIGPLHLLAVDTVVPHEDHGALCEARLDWLDAELEGCNGEPVIVAMHHPPFPTLIGAMDRIGLREGVDELAAIIARHPNVERLICGHLHRAIDIRFAGTIASTGPAPSHQIALDFDADAPLRFTLEPPAFRVFAWTEPTGVVTHLAGAGHFGSPFSFV